MRKKIIMLCIIVMIIVFYIIDLNYGKQKDNVVPKYNIITENNEEIEYKTTIDPVTKHKVDIETGKIID